MADDASDMVLALEAELAALAAADADLERDAEVAERTRIERSTITLRDRLRGARGAVELATRDGSRHSGAVRDVGADWVLLARPAAGRREPAAEHLVLLSAVVALRGLGRSVRVDGGVVPSRTLGSVLRAWCRDRSHVAVLLADGSVLAGLASALFADHLEVSTGGGETVVVPTWAIAVVSR
jgi:hypothetical protein